MTSAARFGGHTKNEPEFSRAPGRPPRTLASGSNQNTKGELSPEAIADADSTLEALRANGLPHFDDLDGPLFWPKVPADKATTAWRELSGWVEQLIERFPHLDHHTIPMCWWRHNGHVEALAALRDHERMCYSDSSPLTAGVEWHRAFRDIEARLREWTSTLACGSVHDPRPRPGRVNDTTEWAEHVVADSKRRAESQTSPNDGNMHLKSFADSAYVEPAP